MTGAMPGGQVARIVTETIAETFGADPASISRATVTGDVDGWDSLGHSVLMVRLSRRLGFEIDDWIASESRSVGHLIDLLAAQCQVAP